MTIDLLERARTLATCPLFGGLAPAVLIRLAERARVDELEPGERRTTDDIVWVVASGSLVVASRGAVPSGATTSNVRKHGGRVTAGGALGMIRVVAPATPPVEAVAEAATTVIGLAVDDVRDVLEEDPTALAALADALAGLLLGATP
jgi:CRP-like cAMP-binding protein